MTIGILRLLKDPKSWYKYRAWRWWLGLFIQGKGYTIYPPIIKWPPILIWSRSYKEGRRYPGFYGYAWVEFDIDVIWMMWYPLNFIARLIRNLYIRTRFKVGDYAWYDKKLHDAYHNGFKDGQQFLIEK